MLTRLRIKNLALVEQVTIEFREGLNIITGETGAGKSMLMGALGLLLGERADKTMIRSGADTCGAEAVFTLQEPSAVDRALEEIGLEPCVDGQLIIRRIIKAAGGGQTLINDIPVTLQGLRRVGEQLVDMHGPHDHQSLLKPNAQLEILDAYGHLRKQRMAYAKRHEGVRMLEERRAELSGPAEDLEEVVDLLRYKVNEIEEAKLDAEEEAEIGEEHATVGHAHQIVDLSSTVLGALSEGEDTAYDRMAASLRTLEELARILPEAEHWKNELTELTARLQELSAAMVGAVGQVSVSPERMEWLDRRLATYQKLKKKYGPSLEEVQKTLETSRERLNDLDTRGEQLARIDEDLVEARRLMEEEGLRLRTERNRVSGDLAKAITEELKALGFARGTFDVTLEASEPGASGMDRIDFGFAPNAGEPMRPLRVIASSGEISRVMLATKAVLAQHDRVPVLVFDEVDANLGGEMGHAVGAKLAAVAEHHQVVCITHLPQVAVFGDTHYAVGKEVRDGRTLTEVTVLENDDSRATEVARMLGGVEQTTVTLQHAREMLGRGAGAGR